MNDEEIVRELREVTEEIKGCPIEGRKHLLVLKQHGYLALLLGDETEGNRLLGKGFSD